MDIKQGDMVQTETGDVGTAVFFNKLTVFVALPISADGGGSKPTLRAN
jgi:hypothetical protein